MKQIERWERPKSSRIYIHPYASERLITVYPDMKITDLDLKDIGMHFDQGSFGVHTLFGTEPDEADMEKTVWKTPENGLPIYTMFNEDEENGCMITMTSFCSTDRRPFAYCEVSVTNVNTYAVKGTMGLLPRYNKQDHYLTGLWNTGYEPYNPNIGQWYLSWQNGFSPVEDGSLTAKAEDGYGFMTVQEYDNCEVSWVSRNEQKNRFRAHDYYRFDYKLAPSETATVRFVIRRGDICEAPSYDEAYTNTLLWWQNVQNKVTKLPGGSKEIEDMFRQNLAVMLQMFAHYEGNYPDDIYTRQGDVGRFQWVWEAAHFTTVLDDVGLGEFVTDAIRMWYKVWQKRDGEDKGNMMSKYVRWDNSNGSAIWATAHHILAMNDKKLFDEFKDGMDLALEYIQYRRNPEKAAEGEVKGLFTSGQASDWGEIGQHWTYTDAVNVYGIGVMAECYEKFGADNAKYVREVYEEYRGVVAGVLEKFSKEHTGELSYNMPHILGTEFEKSYNHCFSTDGCPYLIKLGFMDPNSEIFEQMERFYTEIGMLDLEHGLSSRMTNDDCGAPGLYGHVYYTCVSEILWIEAWMRRGEYDKAAKMAEGILRYHVTPEYITSERYSSVDPWFTPWQPNASGSGRLCQFLLDYYGERQA